MILRGDAGDLLGVNEGLRFSVFQAIGGSFYFDHFRVVDESVDDGLGANHVVEYLAPVFEGSVGRNDGRAAFIAGIDHVKQEFALFLVQGQPSKFVDDQEGGMGVELHDFVLAMGGLGSR